MNRDYPLRRPLLFVAVITERSFERREVLLDDLTNRSNVNAEVLVDEDVPEAANLGPWDFWVCFRDRSWQSGDCFTDDLKVPLERVLGHVGEVAIERSDVTLTTFDRSLDV